MAENTTPTVPSKDALLKHLANVEKESIENQAGKLNCNPFIWVRDNVTPLVADVKAAKEVSKELAAKVTALKALPKPPEEKKQ